MIASYVEGTYGRFIMGVHYNKDWIVPVLKDLEAFLTENGLDEGSKALTDAMAVVQREMRRKKRQELRSEPKSAVAANSTSRVPYLTLVASNIH
jgi:hypothetical protein